jgi:hypothetical protein
MQDSTLKYTCIHLQVNLEAKSFALKEYHLAFDSLDLPGRPKYFRYGRDTLHLRYCQTHLADDMPEIRGILENIQNLSIDCPTHFWQQEHIIEDFLIPFTSLQNLVAQQNFSWLHGDDMLRLGCNREDIRKLLSRVCPERKLGVLFKEVSHIFADGSPPTTRAQRFRSED